MGKNVSWNDIPFNSNASKEQKADEFERQYEENRASGQAKEDNGEHRPIAGER